MARSAGRTRPVIKDVAKLAGVSAPTVSRYLNGTVNVTEDKRERIAKAIKELGYEPSIVARALSNREMDSVVVFAANPSAFSTSETNHGVEAAARKRRFLLNIVSLDESDMDSVKARVRMGLSIRPAGVIGPALPHWNTFPKICRWSWWVAASATVNTRSSTPKGMAAVG